MAEKTRGFLADTFHLGPASGAGGEKTKEQRIADIRTAATIINRSFTWQDSLRDDDYWSGVYEALLEQADCMEREEGEG